MKLQNIFVCFVLSVIVQGNILAAAVRGGIEPIIVSFGAAFAALGLHSDSQPIMYEDLNSYKERYRDWAHDKCKRTKDREKKIVEDIDKIKQPRTKKGKDQEDKEPDWGSLKDEAARKKMEEEYDKITDKEVEDAMNAGFDLEEVDEKFEEYNQSKQDAKVHKSSMVRDDIEANIYRANLHNINF